MRLKPLSIAISFTVITQWMSKFVQLTLEVHPKKQFFTLDDEDGSYHSISSYYAVGKDVTITFFGVDNRNGNETVGFNITMTRRIEPYVMKYYIPSVAVVLVSEVGFVIPLSAIPGRVALLVTQFLTLVNLFIYQMVMFNSLFDF